MHVHVCVCLCVCIYTSSCVCACVHMCMRDALLAEGRGGGLAAADDFLYLECCKCFSQESQIAMVCQERSQNETYEVKMNNDTEACRATLNLEERRSVAIRSRENVVFVQTDKPTYKPGQKDVNGIAQFFLDTYTFTYPNITLKDPQNNRIFQRQNVTSFRNITQLSFQLISEPMFGDYWIVVKRNSRETVTHQFAVKRYVLPKFEVTVNAPQTVTISDDEFQVDVCAYNFGQPVQGETQIRVCREYFSSSNCEKNENEICEQFIAQVQTNLDIFTLLCSSFLTVMQISEKTSVFITQLLGTVNFENMDTFYRRGISYFGQLKFSDPNNVPMVNKLLQLELNDEFIGNYTTDENGEAQFSIDTSDIFDPEFNLKVRHQRTEECYLPSWLTPQYLDAHFLVSRFYSRTNSFLKIVPEPKQLECNQQKVVTVHYSLNSEAYEDDSNVKFFYLNGNFSFPISISADLAPAAVLFVYTLHPSGEIVADSVRFQVDKCFKHKVNIKFSNEQGLPGSNASLCLQAAPVLFCALRAVDRNVLLLKSEQQLSAESVSSLYNMVPSIEPYGYFYHGLNLDDGKEDPCIPQRDMFYNGLYYTPVSNYGDGDIYNIVRVRSLRILENIIQTVRTNFPETWMWDLVSVSSSGSANLSFLIPDTITQWEASGFCVNGDVGFGISSTTTLEVSQPFFIEIASPFSVVQNEQFDLIVNVFSYRNTCVEVSYIWECLPGKVNITVVAESKQSSACPNEGMEQQKLNWKDTVVQSFLVEFLFLGDILGLALQNLVVLQMPYGSGEQNAALLASDTYVLDYLKSTEQLTEEVQSKAFFLSILGYQRQLSFKNSDGSYSVFWQQSQKGSIWLSALTFKTLERMKKYVFIDENVQKQTLIWLSSQQKTSGCFKNDGQLFNHALRNALFCLEAALDSGVTNGYNHAILAYAFALAGKEKQVESLLQTLDQSAPKLSKRYYWERERKPKTEEFPSFIPWAPSAQTEKSCYVLLAVISRKIPDLTYASKIVQWLAQRMNSHGGFSSNQVINVGLILIAARGEEGLFSKDQNTVTFSSEGSSEIFQVNGHNRLLVQRSEVTQAPGEYTVDVEGHGCTFIQIFRYTGIRNKSSMVVIDVKMLSGFTPTMSSIEEVNNRSLIFQHKDSYIEYKRADSFPFSVEQSNLVFNIQPAPAMVYDYYEKGRQATAMP
uniref:Ovostatin homolog 1 n=1 Tax=Homo sapiens TaxID=9606 RepID=OVOS1_HUMAN|nr:RecName: Full=Ovostatin homolog 1; Flags: Precursor [Homo sapiens]